MQDWILETFYRQCKQAGRLEDLGAGPGLGPTRRVDSYTFGDLLDGVPPHKKSKRHTKVVLLLKLSMQIQLFSK